MGDEVRLSDERKWNAAVEYYAGKIAGLHPSESQVRRDARRMARELLAARAQHAADERAIAELLAEAAADEEEWGDVIRHAGLNPDSAIAEDVVEVLTARDRQIAELRAEVERLRGDLTCDACLGTGKPLSGRPCGCGGTGSALDMLDVVRRELVLSEMELARLRARDEALRGVVDELSGALRDCQNALDQLMGDSDLDDDDSPEFAAMQRASRALDALDATTNGAEIAAAHELHALCGPSDAERAAESAEPPTVCVTPCPVCTANAWIELAGVDGRGGWRCSTCGRWGGPEVFDRDLPELGGRPDLQTGPDLYRGDRVRFDDGPWRGQTAIITAAEIGTDGYGFYEVTLDDGSTGSFPHSGPHRPAVKLRRCDRARDDRDVAIWLAGYRAACRGLGETMRQHATMTRPSPGETRAILAEMSALVGAAAAEGCAALTDGYANTTGVCGDEPRPVLVRQARESIAGVDADRTEARGEEAEQMTKLADIGARVREALRAAEALSTDLARRARITGAFEQ